MRITARSPKTAILLMLASSLWLSIGTGCTVDPNRKTSGPNWDKTDVIVVEAEPEKLWRLCREELKDRGFRIDRLDRQNGIIETFPLISRQWFEFWRKDVITSEALAQSSLHTIRRSVHLEILPLERTEEKPLKERPSPLRCRVSIQKLCSAPEAYDGSVWVEEVFSGTAGHVPAWNDSAEKKNSRWITIGRDADLEAAILQSILN